MILRSNWIGCTGHSQRPVFDNAMDMVYDVIPVPDKAQLKELIRSACQELNAQGITSGQTDDY